MPTFVIDKASRPAELYRRQSFQHSYDPAIVLEGPTGSRVAVNHVFLDVSAGNTREKSDDHTKRKGALEYITNRKTVQIMTENRRTEMNFDKN